MPHDELQIMPLKKAWFSTDPATNAQNYDEFQSDAEVTAIIDANPKSILRVDMPHCDPTLAGLHLPLSTALPHAAPWLAEMKRQDLFTLVQDVLFIYDIEIASRRLKTQIGLGCMLSTDDIWDPAGNPAGKIIRNEEIFPEKAQGRADLIRSINHLIGTVNLAAADADFKIEKLLREVARRQGEPTIAALDHRGNVHRAWAIRNPADMAMLHQAFKHEEVVVADGNHRSKAAQIAGLDAFLGVVFCAHTMNIEPYHRMVKDLGMSAGAFVDHLRRFDFDVVQLPASPPFLSSTPNEIGLYMEGTWWHVVARDVDLADPIECLDAKVVENRIVKGILGLDPADHRVTYVGGDYEPSYLQAQVDAGRQQAAFSLPAVTMEQFFRVNAARVRMPRKTTWFSPKIRSGLVLAELD